MPGNDHLGDLQRFRDWVVARRTYLAQWAAIVAAIVAVPVALLYLAPALLVWSAPELDTSKDLYSINRPVAFTFLDADGQIAGHRGAIVGERLSLEQMPRYLPAAFIAMEDRHFYSNEGIDIRGLLRAAWTNLRAGHVVAGGSTITQQTAKILFLSPQRTFARKIQELVDAASLEKSLTKKQILELYLNRIYLGSGAYGVDGAAHVYFGKSARDLTLAEAAMLATLTRAPSAFSPRRDLAAAQSRTDRVLSAMVETGAITRDQAVEARANAAMISDRSLADERNFFLDAAADEALRLIGPDGAAQPSDLIVHTTMQPRLQEAARRAVAHALNAHGRKARAHESAIVLMHTDGAIAALIGGRDYDTSVFNRAMQAKRQPGSAFKPFVYLAAIENGISPWDERDDGPVDIDGWTPTNYGGRSYGSVTLADALAHSINTVTAGLAQEVGINSVVAAAHRCGITSPLAPNASLALGTSEVTPLELTAAYATFASGGLRVWPYSVTEVEDTAHHVLYRRKPPAQERAIASHVDRDMTAMLYGVLVEGTGRGAALPGREAAGKTGTTQDYRDAWFIGFTHDFVAGVWVGNDDSSPMRNVTGGSLPAAIWRDVMTAAEKGLPAIPLDKSSRPAAEDTALESTSAPDNAADSADEESGPAQENGASKPDHRSFWDWLFGNGSSQQAQPSPNPGPSAAQEMPAQVDRGTVEGPPMGGPDSTLEQPPPRGRDSLDAPPHDQLDHGNTANQPPPISGNADELPLPVHQNPAGMPPSRLDHSGAEQPPPGRDTADEPLPPPRRRSTDEPPPPPPGPPPPPPPSDDDGN